MIFKKYGSQSFSAAKKCFGLKKHSDKLAKSVFIITIPRIRALVLRQAARLDPIILILLQVPPSYNTNMICDSRYL